MRFVGGLFSNASRNLRRILHSPVSWGWAIAVMVIQAWVSSQGGPCFLDGWFENLGLSRDGFLSGKIWQILSYGMLHGAWWHARVNALFVLVIGSRIEHVAGRAAMMWVMMAGVLGGGAGHLLLGSGLLVGLSGACLALLLLQVTLSPQSRMLPLPISGQILGIGILVCALTLALINPDLGVPGLSDVGQMLVDHGPVGWFQVGHACHFGGGLAGWLCGLWILRPRVTLQSLRRDRARREG